jgi:hypothetical protein
MTIVRARASRVVLVSELGKVSCLSGRLEFDETKRSLQKKDRVPASHWGSHDIMPSHTSTRRDRA